MSVLAFDGVSFSYPDADRAALHDATVEIGEGTFVLAVGATGAGKSTFPLAWPAADPRLLAAIALLLVPASLPRRTNHEGASAR